MASSLRTFIRGKFSRQTSKQAGASFSTDDRNQPITEQREVTWPELVLQTTSGRDVKVQANFNYVMGESACTLTILDVADALQDQWAYVSGGKAPNGAPLLTLPDVGAGAQMSDQPLTDLLNYLTSIPSMDESERGWVVVLDRRKDKWATVRKQLAHIAGVLGSNVNEVLLVQPSSFLQKAVGSVKSLRTESFAFKLSLISSVDDLHKVIDKQELTSDLGGDLQYNHRTWINERAAVEKFSANTSQVGETLRDFVSCVQEAEFPNSVTATQELIEQHEKRYKELKEDLESIERHGEILIHCFRTVLSKNGGKEELIETAHLPPCKRAHIQAVERLYIQLEETKTRFCEFWLKHEKKLAQCLQLRQFEERFKVSHTAMLGWVEELQTMTSGTRDSIEEVESLMNRLNTLDERAQPEVNEAESVWRHGEDLMESDHYAVDCIRPKCVELQRVCQQYREIMRAQRELLAKSRLLQQRLDQANLWCDQGKDLLATQQLDKFNTSDGAQSALQSLELFLARAQEFQLDNSQELQESFDAVMSPKNKEAVSRTLVRLDEVTLMCDRRRDSLRRLINRPKQMVKVPPLPQSLRGSSSSLSHSTHSPPSGSSNSSIFYDGLSNKMAPNSQPMSGVDSAALTLKRGHVISELVETERTYVRGLSEILDGYLGAMEDPSKMAAVPAELRGMSHILFGNLPEIHAFHSQIFLKELEACLHNPTSVAQRFTERREDFAIYSTYCQNKPASEALINETGKDHPFFKDCKKSLGHILELSAYLLKPVQRITKYQLLLKELEKCSTSAEEQLQLGQAIEGMLCELRHLNDVMHAVDIIGYNGRLSQQGRLILQGTFDLTYEHKRDRRGAIKDQLSRWKAPQRQVFLYENVVLFCKGRDGEQQRDKRAAYIYKSSLETSSIGLTENVKSDKRKFELWRGQRSEVYVLTAPNLEIKQQWTTRIKELLQQQFSSIKARERRDVTTVPIKRVLEHSPSVTPPSTPLQPLIAPVVTRGYHMTPSASGNGSPLVAECVTNNNMLPPASRAPLETGESGSEEWGSASEDNSSDCQYSDLLPDNVTTGFFVALSDYNAVDGNEITMREGDTVELQQRGHQGWWFVRHASTLAEGWVPASYLEVSKRRSTISLHSLNSSHSVTSSQSIQSSHSAGSVTMEVLPATEV